MPGDVPVREVEAGLKVRAVHLDPMLELAARRQGRGDLRRLQPGANPGIVRLVACALGKHRKLSACALHVVALEEQRREVEARTVAGRVERDRVAQRLLGNGDLPFHEGFSRATMLQLRGIGDEAIEERSHEGLGLRAHELRDRVAVDEDDRVRH